MAYPKPKPKPRAPKNAARRRAAAVEASAAARAAAPLGADPAEALQEVLDLHVAELRYAQAKVDALPDNELWRDTMVGRIPNEWIRLRDEKAAAVQTTANNILRAGIADRAVRVQEAQLLLVVTAIHRAAERAGLSRTDVRKLGSALREELPAIEGSIAA